MESTRVSAEEWSLFTTATVDLEAKGLRFCLLCILRLSSREQIRGICGVSTWDFLSPPSLPSPSFLAVQAHRDPPQGPCLP